MHARALVSSPPEKEGAGKTGRRLAPEVRCARMVVEKCTAAYRWRRNIPAFPARWLDGLCRALPGDEFLLSPSPADIRLIDRLADVASANLTVATTARTTRFCRTRHRFAGRPGAVCTQLRRICEPTLRAVRPAPESCSRCPAREHRPAISTAPTRPRPPQPGPRIGRLANRPPCRAGMLLHTVNPKFCKGANRACPLPQPIRAPSFRNR